MHMSSRNGSFMTLYSPKCSKIVEADPRRARLPVQRADVLLLRYLSFNDYIKSLTGKFSRSSTELSAFTCAW